MGTLTVGGKARGRDINPTLRAIIERAAARSPYDVQIFSGDRAGRASGSRHNSNNALDIALVDPSTGQAVPNFKSSVGFPIYAEFAKVAREEQMAVAPDMADQFRWGGGFGDVDLDLMHFDFKPGGAMANWTWEDGGKLTASGERTVANLGPGKVYYNGQRYNAPNAQYANLWETAPAPQDTQSAIASLVAPDGGTQVPGQPSPLMSFAPDMPELASLSGQPSAAPVAIDPDTDRMARVMLAEARGEGDDGMAAVGQVALNRIADDSGRWGDTIGEVLDGEFAAPLPRSKIPDAEYNKAVQIAQGLQDGTVQPPPEVAGATYFANTKTASPNGLAMIEKSEPKLGTVGNHSFYGPGQPAQATQVAAAPSPDLPPSWANGYFPIDEALTGASADSVLMGGPRMDPRRAGPTPGPIAPDAGSFAPSPADVLGGGPRMDPRRSAPGTGPIPPDMGSMLSPDDVLNAGPNLRPDALPAAFRPGPGGAIGADLGIMPAGMRLPPMRPGGAPDAGLVPTPPMRASGLPLPPSNPRRDPFGFPIDVNRPRLNNPDGSFSTEETTTFDAAEVGMPRGIVTVPTIINGQRVSEDAAKAAFAAGQNPAVQSGFASFPEAEAAAQARTGAIPAARATNGRREGMFPSFYGEQPQYLDGLSAAMGGPPQPPAAQDMTASRDAMSGAMDSRFLASDLGFDRAFLEGNTGPLRPQASPPAREQGPFFNNANPGPTFTPPMLAYARTKDDAYSPPQGPFFDAASPNPSRIDGMSAKMGGPPAPYSPDFNFAGTPSPLGPQSGALTNEGAPSAPNWQSPPGVSGMTYAPPMPPAPPAISQGMRDQFNVAFSPGGPGQIMDLQSAFNRQNAPTMTAQDGINLIFGAPPAPAQAPNLAVPFDEVPGSGLGIWNGEGQPLAADRGMDLSDGRPLPVPPPLPAFDMSRFAGATPASAATVASSLPSPITPPSITTQAGFDDRFGAPRTLLPNVNPGVRPPMANEPISLVPEAPVAQSATLPAPPKASREVNATEAAKKREGLALKLAELAFGPFAKILGGGSSGGIFGGIGQTNAFSPFVGGPMINTREGFYRSGGTAPNSSGGMTNWSHGSVGGQPATSWNRSGGGSVVTTTDPFTGATLTGYSGNTI